jgi:hypothetical protein
VKRSSRRSTLAFVAACLLMQTAWILAVPPFRGSDEFDHAYRADSVAHGHWAASEQPPSDGVGRLLPVRPSIVRAAEDVCEFYGYTGRDNCHARRGAGEGLVLASSGAATYSPAFYWIVGTPALLSEGVGALLIMRAMATLLCTVFFGLTFYLLTLGTEVRLRPVALLAGMTPVVVYSTAIAAPNGLEMAAGSTVWAALMLLGADRLDARTQRCVVTLFAFASAVLVSLRQLGPLWFLLSFSTCLALYGLAPYLRLARQHPVLAGLTTVSIGTATAVNVWWVLTATALPETSRSAGVERLEVTLANIPVWILQTIAAFPLRNEQAPWIVYVPYLILAPALIVIALRVGTRRVRLAIALFVLLSQVVPAAITYATLDSPLPGWQGRYALPFTIGFLLVCAAALDWVGNRRLGGAILLSVWLSLALAHVVSVVSVFLEETENDVMMAVSLWPLIDVRLLLPLTVLGTAAAGASALLLPRVSDTEDSKPQAVDAADHA